MSAPCSLCPVDGGCSSPRQSLPHGGLAGSACPGPGLPWALTETVLHPTSWLGPPVPHWHQLSPATLWFRGPCPLPPAVSGEGLPPSASQDPPCHNGSPTEAAKLGLCRAGPR